MKKLIAPLFIIFMLAACSNSESMVVEEKKDTSVNSEIATTEVTEKKQEVKKHDIPTLIVPTYDTAARDWYGLDRYVLIGVEVLKVIGKKEDFEVQEIPMANYDDVYVAFERGDVTLLLDGSSGHPLYDANLHWLSYTYWYGSYSLDGEYENETDMSLAFLTKKDNEYIIDMLDKHIKEMKETGELDEIANRVLK